MGIFNVYFKDYAKHFFGNSMAWQCNPLSPKFVSIKSVPGPNAAQRLAEISTAAAPVYTNERMAATAVPRTET